MPVYQCSSQKRLLTEDMKPRIAKAITDAHVDTTGAPPVFVHVYFNEIPPGIAYSAGEADTKLTGIQGAIRAGRTLEVKQSLTKRIVASWCEITGQPRKASPRRTHRDRLRDPN